MALRESVRPVAERIAERCGIDVGVVRQVLDSLLERSIETLATSGVFSVPGIVRIRLTRKPAQPARSGVNPFTKEPMEFSATAEQLGLRSECLGRLSRGVGARVAQAGE